MLPISVDDTILAVSTGWTPAALGVIRLSGPDAFALADRLTTPHADPPPNPPADRPLPPRLLREIHVRAAAGQAPATELRFVAPHSYTGQNVVELHTIGSLPWLRALCDALLATGARRALPGEFTARAFLNGRLRGDQAEGVLGLLHAQDAAQARRAARDLRAGRHERWAAWNRRLTELLGRVEAGIDFADEDDVRFITPHDLRARIDDLMSALRSVTDGPSAAGRGLPHVALVGLPNAGKSTLFNVVLGRTRAVVSPVVGTTRDVLSAEVEFDGLPVVLQDCAGLGPRGDELELAAHVAAEQAADRADLVLWVHEAAQPWSAEELDALRRVPAERRLIILSKSDLTPGPARDQSRSAAPDNDEPVVVSAGDPASLADLRRRAAAHLAHAAPATAGSLDLASVERHLAAARAVIGEGEVLAAPELVAAELRHAWARVEGLERGPVAEEVLGWIYSAFCFGK